MRINVIIGEDKCYIGKDKSLLSVKINGFQSLWIIVNTVDAKYRQRSKARNLSLVYFGVRHFDLNLSTEGVCEVY